MKNITVSVLMTAFNREKYIGEAIESVLASTYKDFELIIVDDCSKDKTVDIARRYEKIDSRVKVFENKENLGDYPNRNKAAMYAKGKYIKYVDSDDIIYPDCLNIMFTSMEAYGGGLGLACGHFESKPLPVLLSPLESFRQHFFGGGLFGRSPLSAIINREFFIAQKGFNAERMVSDFEFFFRSAKVSGVVCIQDGMVWGRTHKNQEVNDIHLFLKRYQEIEEFYLLPDNCPLSEIEIKRVHRQRRKEKIRKTIKKIILS
jgi:glycosyltransferase involved in cell wall biosynthesis